MQLENTFFVVLEKNIFELDKTYNNILPDFKNSTTLLISSDYSGESPESPYIVFSFLITTLESWSNWEAKRQEIRSKFFTDSRRMSFKKLSDGQRRRALPHYLEAANSLNGLTLSIALQKNVTLFLKKHPL